MPQGCSDEDAADDAAELFRCLGRGAGPQTPQRWWMSRRAGQTTPQRSCSTPHLVDEPQSRRRRSGPQTTPRQSLSTTHLLVDEPQSWSLDEDGAAELFRRGCRRRRRRAVQQTPRQSWSSDAAAVVDKPQSWSDDAAEELVHTTLLGG
jgi:hypothetical protein